VPLRGILLVPTLFGGDKRGFSYPLCRRQVVKISGGDRVSEHAPQRQQDHTEPIGN